MNKQIKTDIVILGAGIGGYEAFRVLSDKIKKYNLNKKITLIDQNNYFTFTPLLHEVASGSIEPQQAAIPLREIVCNTPHDFLKTKVLKISPAEKKVLTDKAEIIYDFCVMSLGSGVNFFNTPGAKENSYTVRTIEQALRLRSDIIKKLDECEKELNISVVGGGYIGVEVAGQLARLAFHDLKKLYPKSKINIRLIQASDTVVPQLPKTAQIKIINRLNKLNIELMFNSAVKEVTAKEIQLADKSLASDITIWSAGVDNVAKDVMEQNYCEKGQIMVNEFLQHQMFDSLYGAGDIICGHNVNESNKFPQIGEAAFHQGQYVANHIISRMRNQPSTKPFEFKSKGTLMPIGENYGIAVFGNIVIDGFFAWWLRRTVYVLFMPAMVRKIKIVINWTLNLFGFRYVIDIQ